jgi:hypothetical protein
LSFTEIEKADVSPQQQRQFPLLSARVPYLLKARTVAKHFAIGVEVTANLPFSNARWTSPSSVRPLVRMFIDWV